MNLREALELISVGVPQASRRPEAVELVASRIEALEAFAATVRASPLADAIFVNDKPAPGPSAASGGRCAECNGKGEVTVKTPTYVQTGWDYTGAPCPACHGTGAAPAREYGDDIEGP